jgi:hypothetical protein
MVRLFILLAAVQLILMILALISCLSADRIRVRNAPRAVWVLLIVLIPLIGPLAYFVWGRPLPPPSEGGQLRRSPRPASPDDDPDFLRSMDTEQSRRDREMLSQWENDLKNGEEPEAR